MAASTEDSPTQRIWTIETPSESSAAIDIHSLVYTPSTAVTSSTIIALHYWGGSGSTFQHVPTLLHAQQHHNGSSRFISISHRGWGNSSAAQPDDPSGYAIHALASDLVRLLLQFHQEGLIPPSGYIFCGHSMGGKVALAANQLIGSLLPEDFPPLHGMLLLAPAPPTPLILPEEMRQQQLHAYDSHESVEWTVRNILTSSDGTRLYGGQSDLDMIIRDCLEGSQGAKEAWPSIGMAEDIKIRHASEGLKDVRIRVLVSRGDRVETVERVDEEVVQRLRAEGYSVKMRVLKGMDGDGNEGVAVGHLLPLEAPEAVAEELALMLRDIEDGQGI